MSTTTDVARRNGHAPAVPQAALAIKPGQLTWDKYQEAALSQIGLEKASTADRAVFLHQCQRTGLDPFSRQIYMIGRNDKQQDGTWRVKWTIQTGIEGWRVIRDRAEKREGLRGILSRFTYYDHDDNERKVWTQPEPPAAIEVTYTVVESGGREVPYTSVLRFTEYVQTKDSRPIAQWATKPVHMLEKCTEADVYRKAFPQDFSGIELSDAMPPEDPDAPPVRAAQQRVTGEQIRQRRVQVVDAEIVDEPTAVPPAPPQTPAAAPSSPRTESAGGTRKTRTTRQAKDAETASPAKADPPAAAPGSPVQGAGEALPPLPGEEEITAPVSGGDAREAEASKAGSPDPGRPDDTDYDTPGTVTGPQLTRIWATLTSDLGYGAHEKDQAREICAQIVRHDLASSKALSFNEAKAVIDTLSQVSSRDDLTALLIAIDKEGQ
jgi:phage recombination protein Bet